ncbi:MAG: TolC family protein [Gemmatimonadota bacterium]|nr:MAG: TolC family protein [Gemmatimonadota bacterium]
MFRRALMAASALLIAAGAGPSDLHAQSGGAGQQAIRLSLAEAVGRAVDLNEDVLIARAERARTEGLAREVRSASLPEIEANINYNRNIQNAVLFLETGDGDVQQIRLGQQNQYSFSVSLQQPLLDFSLGPARTAAKLTDQATQVQIETARVSVALAARLAYYRTLLDKELVLVQEKALEQAEARLREVEAFYRVGTASDFDLLTAQVEVENIRPLLIEARNQLELNTNRLKRTIGLPLDRPIELTDQLKRPGEIAPLNEAIVVALRNRPDLQSQSLVVGLQTQNLKVEKGSAYPTLDLIANLTRQGASSTLFPGGQDFAQSASAGLQFSLPIFDGRARSGRVQQARAAVDRETYRLEQLTENVRLDVQQSHQALIASREQIEASESNIARAERALEIAQTRFRNGLSTQVELNDAELAVTQARTNFAQALFNYNAAQAQLMAAMGER